MANPARIKSKIWGVMVNTPSRRRRYQRRTTSILPLHRTASKFPDFVGQRLREEPDTCGPQKSNQALAGARTYS
jgi:hypothetical protein